MLVAKTVLRAALTCALMLSVGVSAYAKPPKQKKPAASSNTVEVTIEVRSMKKKATITLEMFAKDAPQTVKHFLELAKKEFYHGILFHRYVGGFVVQAGDPKSKKVNGGDIADITPEEVNSKYRLGDGGSDLGNVPLEAKASHVRGTVGLARSRDPNSGDSQFFFNLSDNLMLDGKYCAFAKVVKGIEVMDKLRQGDKIVSIKPAKK